MNGIRRAARRVFNDDTVPAGEKIVSLFEPHTAIIQRGKARPHETEFGHKGRSTFHLYGKQCELPSSYYIGTLAFCYYSFSDFGYELI